MALSTSSTMCGGFTVVIGLSPCPLTWNLGFYELRKERERFLPAKVARLARDGVRYPFLHDVHLSADGHLLQGYRCSHLSGQARIVECVRVANAFMWPQLEKASAERVSGACGEIRERHLVGAADFGMEVVNLARKAVRREPFGHCVWIEERPIDFLRRRTGHSVKLDGCWGHHCLLLVTNATFLPLR